MKALIIAGTIVASIGLTAAITGSIISEEKLLPIAQASDYTAATPHEVAIDQVDSLVADFDNRAVNIIAHDQANVVIEYYESEHDRIDIGLVDGVLTAASDTDFYFTMWGFGFMLNQATIFTVNIYLPAANILDVDVETKNGAISCTDFTSVQNLDLKTYNGAVVVGNIDDVDNIDLVSFNGLVEVADSVCSGDITAETSNGRVVFDNVTAASIYGRTSNGNIDTEQLQSNSIELRTSNGNVTAKVKGVLASYRVNMTTTNGSYYLNGTKVTQNAYNTSLAHTIKLTSSNGNIYLSFVS